MKTIRKLEREFNLSEKIWYVESYVFNRENKEEETGVFLKEDIREFIKRLKEELIMKNRNAPIVDKLAGNKLKQKQEGDGSLNSNK